MLDAGKQERIILFCAMLAIGFGVINALMVLKIKVTQVEAEGDDESLGIVNAISSAKLQQMQDIA